VAASRALTVAALIGLVACVESRDLPLVDGQSYVFLYRDDNGQVERAFAYDASEVPPLVDLESASRMQLLAYDVPLAELPLITGRLVLVPEAPPEEAWPLESPPRWGTLSEVGYTPSVDRIDLSLVKVPRPDCGKLPRVRAIEALSGPNDISTRNVSMGVEHGDHLIMGTTGDDGSNAGDDRSPRLFRVGTSSFAVTRLSGGAAFPDVDLNRGPRAFVDQDKVFVMWPTLTASSASYLMRSISDDGEIGPIEPFSVDPELLSTDTRGVTHFAIDALASARFDGVRTLVALGSGGVLARFDEPTRRWGLVARSPPPEDEYCGAVTTRLLEVTGPGEGLFGQNHGVVVRFDLKAPLGQQVERAPALIPGDAAAYCRSVRAQNAWGLDVLLQRVERDAIANVNMSWRAPGSEAWTTIVQTSLSGQAIVGFGDGFIVGGAAESILYFDAHRRRPELPPRNCGVAGVGANLYTLVAIAEGRVFAGGRRSAVLLEP